MGGVSRPRILAKRTVCAAFGILAVLATAGFSGDTTRKDCVTVSSQATKLVLPILDAMTEASHDPESMREEEGTPFWRAGTLIGKLIDNKTSASDEALVVLLYYYDGEANGEDRLREITARGKKMLPYLYRYRDHCPRIPGHQFTNLRLPRETVEEDFATSIEMIKKGQIIQ